MRGVGRRILRAATASRGSRLTLGYFAVTLFLAFAEGLRLPLNDALIHALGAGIAVLAVLAGFLRYSPASRSLWALILLATTLFAVSDLISAAQSGSLFAPSLPASALDALGYLALLTAVLGRGRWRARFSFVVGLDAVTVAIATALVAWFVVLSPAAATTVSLPVTYRATAYFVVGMVVLISALPLIFERRSRVASSLFLVLGIALLPLSDLLGGAALRSGSALHGSWFDAAQLLALTLIGASGLHPSMAMLSPVLLPRGEHPGDRVESGLLVAALLVVPLIIVLLLTNGRLAADLWPIGGGGILIAGLVAVRVLRRERQLTESAASASRLVAAVEHTADAVWMTDVSGTVTYVNPAFTIVYGWEVAEIVGQDALVVASRREPPGTLASRLSTVADSGSWSGTLANRRKDGTEVSIEATLSALRDEDGRLTGFVQTDRDVTRQRELETAVDRDARERAALEGVLAGFTQASTPEDVARAACTALVDLDGVGSAMCVDLTPGREAVLAAVGRVALVLEAGTAVSEAMADFVREQTRLGSWIGDWRSHPITGMTGLAITSTGLQTIAYAQFRGPGNVVGVLGLGVHQPGQEAALRRRLSALTTFASLLSTLIGPGLGARHDVGAARASIQAVLTAEAFAPYFQPIVGLDTGAVVGHEALTRFTDGRRPDLVFAAAIAANLGLELEFATAEAALKAASNLPDGTYLSLNASPAFIMSGRIAVLIAGTTRPIVLEITEHVPIDDYPGLLSEVAHLGPAVRLAVDDAGAGYASFRHILELQPAVVKLDIALIRNIDADPARQALVAGMKMFAVERDLTLIAEGIETPAELETLRALDVPFGQGYLLGRPADGRRTEPWPVQVSVEG